MRRYPTVSAAAAPTAQITGAMRYPRKVATLPAAVASANATLVCDE